jgi:hypothetical protein
MHGRSLLAVWTRVPVYRLLLERGRPPKEWVGRFKATVGLLNQGSWEDVDVKANCRNASEG